MSNKTYDVLKWVAQILLPAVATLYFAMAGIWGLPMAEQVMGTIVAVDTFLGAILKLNKSQYDKRNSDTEYEQLTLSDRSYEEAQELAEGTYTDDNFEL